MKKEMKNLEDLSAVVTDCLDIISNNTQKDSATVILMYGDLGAGKTTFTQELARQVEVNETVTSPTFVIQKEYAVSHFMDYKKLIHIDAYRLDGKKDLEYLGWDALVTNRENLIILEWPSMVNGIDFGTSVYQCDLSINIDHGRSISFKKIT